MSCEKPARTKVSALLSPCPNPHFYDVLWERDYMKRRPDADEAVESESPRPPFNLFAGLSGTPLAPGASSSNQNQGKPADRDDQTEKAPLASPTTSEHSTEKRRWFLIVMAALLIGALIGMALL
jgi:hypothetical protein